MNRAALILRNMRVLDKRDCFLIVLKRDTTLVVGTGHDVDRVCTSCLRVMAALGPMLIFTPYILRRVTCNWFILLF